MHSNNVVGTVQPLEEIVGVLEERREGSIFPIFHTDAAQSIGKVKKDATHIISFIISLFTSDNRHHLSCLMELGCVL